MVVGAFKARAVVGNAAVAASVAVVVVVTKVRSSRAFFFGKGPGAFRHRADRFIVAMRGAQGAGAARLEPTWRRIT